MHIEVENNNLTKYLRMAKCRRGTNSKGKKRIATIKRAWKMECGLAGVARLLVCGWILETASRF